jgi:hypothetical protein
MARVWKVCIFFSKRLIARHLIHVGDCIGGIIFIIFYGVLELHKRVI